jgi:hypothetical protein
VVRWPQVVDGKGDRPRAIGRAVEPGLRLARGLEVVAWGSVDGVPWQIQAFVTAPGRNARWWEHAPVGPGLEFGLGEAGWFGGGEAGTRLNGGTHPPSEGSVSNMWSRGNRWRLTFAEGPN